MNQLIPSKLAILFILVFAFAVGFFLLRFNEKMTAEIDQLPNVNQKIINNAILEMRKNK